MRDIPKQTMRVDYKFTFQHIMHTPVRVYSPYNPHKTGTAATKSFIAQNSWNTKQHQHQDTYRWKVYIWTDFLNSITRSYRPTRRDILSQQRGLSRMFLKTRQSSKKYQNSHKWKHNSFKSRNEICNYHRADVLHCSLDKFIHQLSKNMNSAFKHR